MNSPIDELSRMCRIPNALRSDPGDGVGDVTKIAGRKLARDRADTFLQSWWTGARYGRFPSLLSQSEREFANLRGFRRCHALQCLAVGLWRYLQGLSLNTAPVTRHHTAIPRAAQRMLIDRWKHLRGTTHAFAPSCFHCASTGFAEARFWKQGCG